MAKYYWWSEFYYFSFLKKFPIVLSLSLYSYLLTKLFLFVILISPDTLDQLEVHEDVFGKNAKYLQGRCFYCTCSFLFIYYLWYNVNSVSFLKKIEIANEHGIYKFKVSFIQIDPKLLITTIWISFRVPITWITNDVTYAGFCKWWCGGSCCHMVIY